MTGRKVVAKDARRETRGPVPAPSVTGDERRVAKAERSVASAELFAGSKEVVIEHEGERYRLRCTSKGKLILTK